MCMTVKVNQVITKAMLIEKLVDVDKMYDFIDAASELIMVKSTLILAISADKVEGFNENDLPLIFECVHDIESYCAMYESKRALFKRQEVDKEIHSFYRGLLQRTMQFIFSQICK